MKIDLNGSVLRFGWWVTITPVVPSETPACDPWKAPAATAPAWVSLQPLNTRVDSLRPSAAATEGVTGPTSEPTGTSSANLSRPISDCSTRRGSYSVAPSDRLSIVSDMNAVHWLAVARPLNFAVR